MYMRIACIIAVYERSSEPYNFAQQAGVFEVHATSDPGHERVMLQMIPEPPVDTCRPERMPRPVTLIGDYAWCVCVHCLSVAVYVGPYSLFYNTKSAGPV